MQDEVKLNSPEIVLKLVVCGVNKYPFQEMTTLGRETSFIGLATIPLMPI
jgi:hypothetical protein